VFFFLLFCHGRCNEKEVLAREVGNPEYQLFFGADFPSLRQEVMEKQKSYKRCSEFCQVYGYAKSHAKYDYN
jgi:hypothetical protein